MVTNSPQPLVWRKYLRSPFPRFYLSYFLFYFSFALRDLLLPDFFDHQTFSSVDLQNPWSKLKIMRLETRNLVGKFSDISLTIGLVRSKTRTMPEAVQDQWRQQPTFPFPTSLWNSVLETEMIPGHMLEMLCEAGATWTGVLRGVHTKWLQWEGHLLRHSDPRLPIHLQLVFFIIYQGLLLLRRPAISALNSISVSTFCTFLSSFLWVNVIPKCALALFILQYKSAFHVVYTIVFFSFSFSFF